MEFKGETMADRYCAHKCPEATLRGIDRANELAWEPWPQADESSRPYWYKLRDGWRLIRAGDSSDPFV